MGEWAKEERQEGCWGNRAGAGGWRKGAAEEGEEELLLVKGNSSRPVAQGRSAGIGRGYMCSWDPVDPLACSVADSPCSHHIPSSLRLLMELEYQISGSRP